MDTQPSIDRSILFPIALGGLSIIGIIVVLLVGRALNSPAVIAVTPSATRFQYVYLGTEPAALVSPSPEGSETAVTEEAVDEQPTEEEPGVITPVIVTSATSSISTPIILTPAAATNTPNPTSTSASVAPLNPGTYDNIDTHFAYNGFIRQSNVNGAYQGTLDVSQQPGSTISFRFIGTQLRLFYQGGSTLGTMSIAIDNQSSSTLNQSSGTEWVSSTLANATHTVSITHIGGGAVNLDYVIIPEVPNTATPTATITLTLTPLNAPP